MVAAPNWCVQNSTLNSTIVSKSNALGIAVDLATVVITGFQNWKSSYSPNVWYNLMVPLIDWISGEGKQTIASTGVLWFLAAKFVYTKSSSKHWTREHTLVYYIIFLVEGGDRWGTWRMRDENTSWFQCLSLTWVQNLGVAGNKLTVILEIWGYSISLLNEHLLFFRQLHCTLMQPLMVLWMHGPTTSVWMIEYGICRINWRNNGGSTKLTCSKLYSEFYYC